MAVFGMRGRWGCLKGVRCSSSGPVVSSVMGPRHKRMQEGTTKEAGRSLGSIMGGLTSLLLWSVETRRAGRRDMRGSPERAGPFCLAVTRKMGLERCRLSWWLAWRC